MEQIAKPKALIVPLILIVIILNYTCLVHSRNLETSPSPAPASIGPATYTRSLNPHEGRKANPRLGSFPATCQTKCNRCKPCVPVEVTIRTMAEEKNQYYPIAWKCMCQSNLFSP
ncbi:EPIDERMAL PATTERNING FACTOR protein 8 [Spatholobus suberectus]|nr:EPIDERMAL PATTERNING FACTOR protein 8 [Spatholobus suberectus]